MLILQLFFSSRFFFFYSSFLFCRFLFSFFLLPFLSADYLKPVYLCIILITLLIFFSLSFSTLFLYLGACQNGVRAAYGWTLGTIHYPDWWRESIYNGDLINHLPWPVCGLGRRRLIRANKTYHLIIYLSIYLLLISSV